MKNKHLGSCLGFLNLKGAVTGAVFALGMFASMSAQATDRKIYAGTSCHSLGSVFIPQYHENGGGWKNLNGVPTRMLCPITRDESGATSDMSVKIFVHDPASGSGTDFQVRCWVHTVNTSGTILESVFGSTSDSGTGYSSISLTAITPGSGEGNAVLITCNMPVNGRIMSYQVTEAEQND